jgi:hypothetical protein
MGGAKPSNGVHASMGFAKGSTHPTKLKLIPVIACDKHEAFAQGSEATKQSSLRCRAMNCFAEPVNGARIRATRCSIRVTPPGPNPSALMRSPHHLHGVLDMTPLIGFFGVTLALASQGIFGRLRNSSGAMSLEHLPRDGVDLGFGCHLALRDVSLIRAAGTGSAVAPAVSQETAEPEVSFLPARTI